MRYKYIYSTTATNFNLLDSFNTLIYNHIYVALLTSHTTHPGFAANVHRK